MSENVSRCSGCFDGLDISPIIFLLSYYCLSDYEFRTAKTYDLAAKTDSVEEEKFFFSSSKKHRELVLDAGTHITQISRFSHKTYSLKSGTVQLQCLYSDMSGVLIKIYRVEMACNQSSLLNLMSVRNCCAVLVFVRL